MDDFCIFVILDITGLPTGSQITPSKMLELLRHLMFHIATYNSGPCMVLGNAVLWDWRRGHSTVSVELFGVVWCNTVPVLREPAFGNIRGPSWGMKHPCGRVLATGESLCSVERFYGWVSSLVVSRSRFKIDSESWRYASRVRCRQWRLLMRRMTEVSSWVCWIW